MVQNFFEIFDLPVAFDIDLELLTARYRDLQRAVHPDRFVRATAQERRLAMERASDINQGFRCLKDPIERALLLIRLGGVNVDDKTSTAVDPVFLMEQMELRETLAEIRSKSSTRAGLEGVKKEIERLEHEVISKLRDDLKRGGKSLPDALQGVQKLRFVHKLRSEAREIEDAMVR